MEGETEEEKEGGGGGGRGREREREGGGREDEGRVGTWLEVATKTYTSREHHNYCKCSRGIDNSAAKA